MGNKKTKNKRNRELKIIFFIILVAAVLFIISTYAWFTTQKNVSITNLNGTVEVAEGLEISLDGETWANEIVLGDDVNIIDSAYEGHRNISPVEMLPVSTLGKTITTADVDLQMLRGKVTNSTILSDIVAMDETLALDKDQTKHNSANAQYPGYFAYDIFLKNSSKQTDTADVLQLNYDSSVQIISEGGDDTVGLQNTVRVALAKYGGEYKNNAWTGTASVTAGQAAVLEKTGASKSNAAGVYITDVAIWEPNASDHVEYIVTNNNKITWSATDGPKYGTKNDDTGIYEFSTTTKMPTYALANASISKEIKNIYHWDIATEYTIKGDTTKYSNSTTLAKQNTLQTTSQKDDKGVITSYNISEGVQNLVSATDGTTAFSIAPNSILRLRVYVWLEGQDVDCINYASYGGGITVNLGLVKGSKIGSKGEATAE